MSQVSVSHQSLEQPSNGSVQDLVSVGSGFPQDAGSKDADCDEESQGDGEGKNKDGVAQEGKVTRGLTYPLTASVPAHVSILYGVQQLLENAAGFLAAVYAVHVTICAGDDWLLFAELMSIMIFILGLGTLLQVAFGFRLPILEGNAFAYIPPIVAMMQTEAWACPEPCDESNSTAEVTDSTAPPCEEEPWRPRLLEISGSLMCAGAVQMGLGLFGLIGPLMRYISPLTIAVTVALLGISLFPTATGSAEAGWGIAILTFVLYIIFALILGPIPIPLPAWNRTKRFHWIRYPIFRTFPSLLAMGLSWLLCYILTITDVFPDDPDHPNYFARTDAKIVVLEEAQWFFLPYPGRYGLPTVGVGIFVGFLGSVISSTIESIGDYYAIARVVEVPPPPKHAFNRGILTEGFCTMIAGSMGSCLGTTSYSAVAGIISITGLASRVGWMVISCVFMVAGVIGKFGAFLAICPDPIIGGFSIVGMGMIIAVGLSCLRHCDMRSVRNLVIVGSSMMLGMMVPYYMGQNPGAIKTGSEELDQILTIILSTAMLVGGITCFILDNVVRPGSLKERGILSLRVTLSDQPEGQVGHKLSPKSEVHSHQGETKDNISIKEKPTCHDLNQSDGLSQAGQVASDEEVLQRDEDLSQGNPVNQEDGDAREELIIEECRKAYDLPWVSDWLRDHKGCTYVPFLPSYIDRPVCKKRCRSSCRKGAPDDAESGYGNGGFVSGLDGCDSVAETDAQSRL